MKHRRLLTVTSSIALGFNSIGCSDANSRQSANRLDQQVGELNKSHLAGNSTMDPKPLDSTSIASQLQRYRGQTEFLNPQPVTNLYSTGTADGWETNLVAASDSSRAIQEADIFKVGKPGSKVVFLLNNFRGLQVVSFQDGADQPSLLGRVQASGNIPDQMYYQSEQDRLVVVETIQFDSRGNYSWSKTQGRLVIYDVSDLQNPRVSEVIEFEGSPADSRLVGEVLYVATSLEPDWQVAEAEDAELTTSGFVHSFSFKDSELRKVDSLELGIPVVGQELMNLIEVSEEDGRQAYYLVAALASRTWWDGASRVAVVDVSNPEGSIKPIMIVEARGLVDERSQITIKDQTLIVTSNYFVDDQLTNRQGRIAMETFSFPAYLSQTITTDEAEFRQSYIRRQLKEQASKLSRLGLPADEIDRRYELGRRELLNDPQYGLASILVKGDGQFPTQLAAQDQVLIKSSDNQSAALQDVRYAGDLALVFWVPSNNIDPLEIIDLSNPRAGIKHLGRLEFDGWVQRAFPVTVGERQFVIGFGWVVAGDDSQPFPRRYPRAMAFELQATEDGTAAATLIETLDLGTTDQWAEFNGSDKAIEVRFDDEGRGSAMYTFSSYEEGQFFNGGKLIGFDLTKFGQEGLPVGENNSIFEDGAILNGGEGWLRRLFYNEDLDRLTSFSDQSLGVFDVDDLGPAGDVVEASAILELARHIQAYVSIGNDEQKKLGVQIISSPYDQANIATTELRLTGLENADAELSESLQVLSLPGSYNTHLSLGNGDLVVLTSSFVPTSESPVADSATANVSEVSETESDFFQSTTYTLSKIGLLNQEITILGQTEWLEKEEEDVLQPFGNLSVLYETATEDIISINRGVASVVAAHQTNEGERAPRNAQFSRMELKLDGCSDEEGLQSYQLLPNDESLYITWAISVEDKRFEGLSHSKHFVASAELSNDSTLTCGLAVNIPGEPLRIVSSHLVTRDSRLLDVIANGAEDADPLSSEDLGDEGDGEDSSIVWVGQPAFRTVTQDLLASVNLQDDAAVLIDLYDPGEESLQSLTMVGNNFVLWEGLGSDDEMIIDRDYQFEDLEQHYLVTLNFDADQRFTRSLYQMDLSGQGPVTARGAYASDNGNWLLPITQGSAFQVVELFENERPQLRNIELQGPPTVEDAANQRVVKLASPWGFYWSGNEDGIHFSSALGTFELSQDLYGVQQVKLIN